MKTSDFAASSAWAGIAGKPAVFPPDIHAHALADISRSGAKGGDVATYDAKSRKWVPRSTGISEILEESNRGFARLREDLTVIADEQHSLVDSLRLLEVEFNSSRSSIEERLTTLATADFARATAIREITSRVETAESSIRRVEETTATAIASTSSSVETFRSAIDGNTASITTILSTYATKTFAEAKRSEAISVAASYTDEVLDEVTGGFAGALDDLELRVTAVEGDVTSLGTRTTTLESQVNTPTTGILARISTVETTKASSSDLTAVADRTTTLESQVNTPTTGILAKISTIESTYATDSEVSAAISSEVTARNDAISTAVTTESSARIAADGAIHAQWGVRLDVNGRVIGRINLDGSNGTSTLDFDAATIRLWNGSSAIAPFSVTGGIVDIGNARIGGFTIGSGALSAGSGVDKVEMISSTTPLIRLGDSSGTHIEMIGGFAAGEPLFRVMAGANDRVVIGYVNAGGVDSGSIEVTKGSGGLTTVRGGGFQTDQLLTVTNLTSSHQVGVNRFAGDGIDVSYYETGDRNSVVDFHAQTDGGISARLLRSSGANGQFEILSNGSGDLFLNPGTGYVKFGELTADTGLTVAGWIGMKDAGGTVRKVMIAA